MKFIHCDKMMLSKFPCGIEWIADLSLEQWLNSTALLLFY